MKKYLIPISVAILVLAGFLGVLVGPEARWQYKYHTGSPVVKQILTIEKEYDAEILGVLRLEGLYVAVFVEAFGTREGRDLTLDLLNLLDMVADDSIQVYIIVSVYPDTYVGIAELNCKPGAYVTWNEVIGNCMIYPWTIGDVRPIIERAK